MLPICDPDHHCMIMIMITTMVTWSVHLCMIITTLVPVITVIIIITLVHLQLSQARPLSARLRPSSREATRSLAQSQLFGFDDHFDVCRYLIILSIFSCIHLCSHPDLHFHHNKNLASGANNVKMSSFCCLLTKIGLKFFSSQQLIII